jgi:deazaflavin-dependent oxidoreductase (nitroreductase family)
MRLALRRGLAAPNVLLIVRGRVSGRPYPTPVALWELGDRRFVQASFGDVGWARNLRAAGQAVVRRGSWSEPLRAVELPSEVAGELMHDALAVFGRRRALRILLGPTVRPPAAILYRYRLRVDERLTEYVAEATRHPLFELVRGSSADDASAVAEAGADPQPPRSHGPTPRSHRTKTVEAKDPRWQGVSPGARLAGVGQ